jgi:hypothetical protein
LDDATGYNCRIDRCCTCSGSSVAAAYEQRAGSGLWASSVRHGPTWPLPAWIAIFWTSSIERIDLEGKSRRSCGNDLGRELINPRGRFNHERFWGREFCVSTDETGAPIELNGSTKQWRATALAIPLLQEAKQVRVVSVDGWQRCLACARSPGFDFPIKVAYAQGQLRQLIFGGITRHILANATLPSSRRIDP